MAKTSISFDDLVLREARYLASEILRTELEKQSLPMPKDAVPHADLILASQPNLMESARQRVEARKDAYSESLEAIGVNVEVVKPLDIEI